MFLLGKPNISSAHPQSLQEVGQVIVLKTLQEIDHTYVYVRLSVNETLHTMYGAPEVSELIILWERESITQY